MSSDETKRSKTFGRWSERGLPHTGWACVGVEDLGEPSAICEMCDRQEIRYVYSMQHSDVPNRTLEVGCVCAEKMEGDYKYPQQREKMLKNAAQRKKKWLSRQWRTSYKGNHYLNTDGFNVVVFQKSDGSWGGTVKNRRTNKLVKSRRRYQTEEQAKLAAFDAMISLKDSQC